MENTKTLQHSYNKIFQKQNNELEVNKEINIFFA